MNSSMNLLDSTPRLKAHIIAEVLPDINVVFLLSEQESIFFEDDEIYTHLIPLMDGRNKVKEIILQLQSQCPFTEVVGRINHLYERNLVTFQQFEDPVTVSTYHDAKAVIPKSQVTYEIAVHVFGNLDPTELKAVCQQHGLKSSSTSASLALVITDDYLHPELEQFNQQAQQSWLLVKPVGAKIWLGPLIIPGETACWSCLAQRLRLNQPLETFISNRKGSRIKIPADYSTTTLHMAMSLAATEVEHWLANEESHSLLNTLLTVDAKTSEQERHCVIRRPQCPACGDPATPEPKPIQLKSRARALYQDGGYRVDLPETTLKQLQAHISPITGLVPELKSLTDDGVSHVYDAGNRFAFTNSNGDWQQIQNIFKNRAVGKGVTKLQSQVSSLAEALERYCSWYDGTEPHRIERYVDLADNAIHPNACMNYSQRQYQDRQALNEQNKNSFTPGIPLPFDEEQALPWTPLWSLTENVWRYVPSAWCYIAYPQKRGQEYCIGDSNGNAAGTSLEDAILQGFFELVERDCVGLWWHNRLSRPGVHLERVDDAYISSLRQVYNENGRDFWALDLTNDLGIPCFAVISKRIDGRPEYYTAGFGAHLDAHIALMRAITEMNQTLPIVQRIMKNKDDTVPVGKSNTLLYAKIKEENYLCPDITQAEKNIDTYVTPTFDDLRENILYCLDILRDKNLEMMVLDLTRPDVGLPVVKVVVPGLRHHWQQLGPGRLYDVPVQMGWLHRPRDESEMNPLDWL